METTPILGVNISRLGFEQALKACLERSAQAEGGYVCFANVHNLIESHWNSEVRGALNGASFAVADGVPLVWASQWGDGPIASRVCGPDFMKAYLEKTSEEIHGMIGGAPGQGQALAEKLGFRAVCYSPPMRFFSAENAREDWLKFLELCPGGRPPAVVWVGLGAPKQELWMRAVSPLAPSTLFFGVGAAYDFLAGNKSRAPMWMQKNGLEWLYRLTQEPGRLWRRYLYTNSLFLFLLGRQAAQSMFLSFYGVLALQLLLSWFAPPLMVGNRSLFLGDLWFFLWVPVLLLQHLKNPAVRWRILPWLVISLGVAGICWAHGSMRPTLGPKLQTLSIELREGDAFSPMREGVIAFRFLVWFWAGVAVAFRSFREREVRALSWVLAFSMGWAALIMVACKLSPSLAVLFGHAFGYVPESYPWIGRVYGPFRSPNEAGAALGLGALLVAGGVGESRSLRSFVFGAAYVGAGLAKAATSLASVFLSVLGGKLSRWPRIATSVLLSTVAVGAFALPLLSSRSDFIENKIANLTYRLGPWKIYVDAAFSAWDRLLFGMGFNQYNVDDSYIFLLNRGGLLLLGGMLFVLAHVVRRRWSSWNAYQRSVIVFLVLTSVTLDTVILRPLVALLIVGIPLLQSTFQQIAERVE